MRSLKTKKDFKRARYGKKIIGRAFVAYSLSNEQNCARLGVSVSKKVGKAVFRNYLKRAVKAAFVFVSPPPRDYLFIAKTSLSSFKNATKSANGVMRKELFFLISKDVLRASQIL